MAVHDPPSVPEVVRFALHRGHLVPAGAGEEDDAVAKRDDPREVTPGAVAGIGVRIVEQQISAGEARGLAVKEIHEAELPCIPGGGHVSMRPVEPPREIPAHLHLDIVSVDAFHPQPRQGLRHEAPNLPGEPGAETPDGPTVRLQGDADIGGQPLGYDSHFRGCEALPPLERERQQAITLPGRQEVRHPHERRGPELPRRRRFRRPAAAQHRVQPGGLAPVGAVDAQAPVQRARRGEVSLPPMDPGQLPLRVRIVGVGGEGAPQGRLGQLLEAARAHTDFQVSMSIKPQGHRRKDVKGKASMLYLREADGNKETDIYGVILPKRWVEGSWHEGNPSGIFRYDGNILNELASKLAGIMGDGAVECYAGMPTESKLMPISIQRYTELKDAHTFLMDLYSMERLYDIVRESYKRYMKYIADLSMDSALEFTFSHKPADMATIFTTATIECTAFLALFRLYWENLTGDSKSPGQRFFLTAKERDTLDEIARAAYSDNPKQIDALVQGLCPLALHGKPIADFITWQHKRNENDYHHLFSSSVKIETSDKIPSHLRETAKKCLHDGKPLPESLAEGIEALSSIHLKIRKALEPRTASARVSIENSMQEWKAHTGEEPSETDINNLFTIFERNRGCELDISETNGYYIQWLR